MAASDEKFAQHFYMWVVPGIELQIIWSIFAPSTQAFTVSIWRFNYIMYCCASSRTIKMALKECVFKVSLSLYRLVTSGLSKDDVMYNHTLF